MRLTDEDKTLLAKIDYLFEKLKQVENINERIFLPVHNECRYILRHGVDYIKHTVESKGDKKKESYCKLNTAISNANYDLMDIVITIITRHVKYLTTRITLLDFIEIIGFEKYVEIVNLANILGDKVSYTRGRRREHKEKDYEQLYVKYYPKAIEVIKYLRSDGAVMCLKAIKQKAKRKKAKERKNTILTIVGIIIGILGLVLGFATIF